MAIFRVPYQKHVIYPLFKFEIKNFAKRRYSVCLIRNEPDLTLAKLPQNNFKCPLSPQSTKPSFSLFDKLILTGFKPRPIDPE